MSKCPYLIIGNSIAAMGAVEGIRAVDKDSPITLIAREPHPTYSRPLISYLLAGKVDEKRMLYRPDDFFAGARVTAVLGVEAVSVDTSARVVKASDGRVYEFEKLLIATGGKPLVPDLLPGAGAEGVFTFTTWDDARKIKAYLDQSAAKQAVVVGGGLIGLKAVEALVALKVATTVVELADRILSATFDKAASDIATKFLRKEGVEVRCGTTVSAVDLAGGRVAGVTLRDGTKLACGLLILAIGVVPDTRIVAGTGVRVERGIVTDETMQTSVAGIYAAGDVTQSVDVLSGASRPIPIFPNAYRQGVVAGSNMAGRRTTFEGGMAMNSVDICGLPTISVGITDPQEDGFEVLSALDEEKSLYRKIVLKGDRIVGAIFIGQIDRAGIITGLIREKVDVASFKHLLLNQDFGLISLPAEYRKHIVAGEGVEV